jgi:protein tyrosine/serine phosphatase
VAVVALAVTLLSCAMMRPDGQRIGTDRPATWAVPMDRAGIPNLHEVAPTFYRGAQPTAEGMRVLSALGVRTVINLRALHDDADLLEGTDLGVESICFNTWHPEEEDVVRFLRLVTDPVRQPVFVHCMHGADRTGMMCAIYRVAVCGWTKDEAIREMTTGGFGYHAMWNDVVRYVQDLDVARIRSEAHLAIPVGPAARF